MNQTYERQTRYEQSSSYGEDDEYEQARRERRAQRIAEMKRRKRKQALYRRLALRLAPVLVGIVILCVVLTRIFSPAPKTAQEQDTPAPEAAAETVTTVPGADLPSAETAQTPDEPTDAEAAADSTITPTVDNTVYRAEETSSTDHFFNADEVNSVYGIVVDTDFGTILAEQNAYTKVSPASMTKILTVLVAAEHVTDLDDTFTITQEINDYVFSHDCSAVNFDNDEVVTVRDLFYGTILPSGADAALGLATYVAGSQEDFVKLMNDKLSDLGLSQTAHFTNCTGLYDENHYCTMYDMAMILEAAINNPICREVMSAHTYTTSSTPQHPDGIEISNWFLRRIEDKDTHGEVVCAKTGYVVQSRNCAASYGTDKNGKGYIIVTGDAHSAWRCIYDHVALYDKYLMP